MYQVETQRWKRWPKVLVMRRDDGKERRYIPEPECETDMTGLPTRVRLDGFWYALEEMTCRNMQEYPMGFICSECGCAVRITDSDGEPTMWECGVATVPKYCPSCGARVEEE